MASELEQLEAGSKISFYEILPLGPEADGKPRIRIGEGGFGATYKVGRGTRVYALKLALQPLSSYSAQDRQWMEERGDREIAALKSLRHPNIVRIHAFDRWPDEDGHSFIVMDFVDGSTLDEWRIRAAPSLRQICEAMRSIALALHVAHKQHIFHRDLKCANVLVRVDGEPVIVDWGLSRPASTYSITQGNQMVGTYTCFAPEYCRWAFGQSNERFEWTAATELYVVGYMLFQLLTGCDPYKRQPDDVAMMKEIVNAEIPLPSSINPEVPANLDELVLNLLDKDPQNRFQTGEALAQRLDEILATAAPEWDRPLASIAPPRTRATLEERPGRAALSKNEPPPAPVESQSIPPTDKLAPKPKISLLSLHKPNFVPVESAEAAEANVAGGTPTSAVLPSLPTYVRQRLPRSSV